jgi:DnaJ-class molecular chaperone
MGKTFNSEKYNMVFCPVCNGKGKLPKNPRGFDVCRKCGGFGLVKRELEEDMNTSPTIGGGEEAHMKEGDIFESLLDGTEYVVKKIVSSMVVLHSSKGDRQILTGVGTLKTKTFYREKEEMYDTSNQKNPLCHRS